MPTKDELRAAVTAMKDSLTTIGAYIEALPVEQAQVPIPPPPPPVEEPPVVTEPTPTPPPPPPAEPVPTLPPPPAPVPPPPSTSLVIWSKDNPPPPMTLPARPVDPGPCLPPLAPQGVVDDPQVQRFIKTTGPHRFANKRINYAGIYITQDTAVWQEYPDHPPAGVFDVEKIGAGQLFRRKGGSLFNLTYQRIRHEGGPASGGNGCLQFGGPCFNIKVLDLWFRATVPLIGTTVNAGVGFAGNTPDVSIGDRILLERCYVEGMKMEGSPYNNADAFACEKWYLNALLNDIRGHDCSDGGLDWKAYVEIGRAHMSLMRYSYRLWNGCTADHLVSENPRVADFSLMGKSSMPVTRVGRHESRAPASVPLVAFNTYNEGSLDQTPSHLLIDWYEGPVKEIWGSAAPQAKGSIMEIKNLGIRKVF